MLDEGKSISEAYDFLFETMAAKIANILVQAGRNRKEAESLARTMVAPPPKNLATQH